MSINKLFSHAFSPGAHNNHRPHLFRHYFLSIYSIILIVSHLSFGVTAYTPIYVNPETLKNELLGAVNNERVNHSLEPLAENEKLNAAAEAKLIDMFENNYWDHTSPSGKKAWAFIDRTGYTYTAAGENLARNFTSADKTVSAWMNSTKHRDNILNDKYEETAIAVGNGIIEGNMTTVSVQLFGDPSEMFTEERTLVAGDRVAYPNISFEKALDDKNLPFFFFYLVIFALLIYDGVMLRASKLHKKKKQLLAYRMSLALSSALLLILIVNLAYVL